MDYIDKVLTANAIDQQFSAPIRAALIAGKQTLHRYYTKTDASDVYRIAMGMLLHITYYFLLTHEAFPVLHPRHKLEYFKNSGRPEKWCKRTYHVVRDTFDAYYFKKQPIPGDEVIIKLF